MTVKESVVEEDFFVNIRGQRSGFVKNHSKAAGTQISKKKENPMMQESMKKTVFPSCLFHTDWDAAVRAVAALPREWRPCGLTPGGLNNLWRQSLEEALKASGGSCGGVCRGDISPGTPKMAPSR